MPQKLYQIFSLISDANIDTNVVHTENITNLQKSNSNTSPNSRTPRKFFQKIHSGAAFLTGLKLGAILSNKGFDLGHGSVSSSHSFQLFGKSVNSALSLSYGDVAPILPLVDDVTQNITYRIEDEKPYKDKDNVLHVTVIQNPSIETFEKLKEISAKNQEAENDSLTRILEEDSKNPEQGNEIELYQDSQKRDETTRKPNEFLEEHNKRVLKFNQNLINKRTNSKF